jgi:uncharacterized protein (TIGR03089 family)
VTWADVPTRVAALARREPGAPLLTFYDDDTGERTELSRATAQNWVAKTAGFLTDDLEVERGDRVGLALHPHWQAAVTALACWWVGAAVVPVDPEGGALRVRARLAEAHVAVALAREDLLPDLATARPGALRELVGVSQRPLAARLRSAPPGVLDLAAEVPPQPDDFAPLDPAEPADEALVTADGALDAAGLLDRSEAAVTALGLTAADRLLLTPAPDRADAFVLGLAAPALAGAGVVLSRRWPGAGLLHRLEQERVTLLLVDEVQAASALTGLSGPVPGLRVRGVVPTGSGGQAATALADRLGVPVLPA